MLHEVLRVLKSLSIVNLIFLCCYCRYATVLSYHYGVTVFVQRLKNCADYTLHQFQRTLDHKASTA